MVAWYCVLQTFSKCVHIQKHLFYINRDFAKCTHRTLWPGPGNGYLTRSHLRQKQLQRMVRLCDAAGAYLDSIVFGGRCGRSSKNNNNNLLCFVASAEVSWIGRLPPMGQQRVEWRTKKMVVRARPTIVFRSCDMKTFEKFLKYSVVASSTSAGIKYR